MIEKLLLKLPLILFLVGLILINASIYFLFDWKIGFMITGVSLVVIGLMMNYEQTYERGD
ncbi:hypothetical protein [Abyssicoccus albus]|uniref:hypothetical protein n=1 Tax=Abyssicoccus albus TaxID=1817405 RepID=UPI00097E3542|nr:hypothetical protein [Abyssicoccus albus]AQL56422.1 hypothetical protein BVH56_05560 [Abyssicoccus albus]